MTTRTHSIHARHPIKAERREQRRRKNMRVSGIHIRSLLPILAKKRKTSAKSPAKKSF